MYCKISLRRITIRKKKPVDNRDLAFARPMGNALLQARDKSGFTQGQVAERAGVDPRTILNIENGNRNPTMEKLYPLVRFYGIDPKAFFHPEQQSESSVRVNLRLLLETCTEQEAGLLIPIVRAVLDALWAKDSDILKNDT